MPLRCCAGGYEEAVHDIAIQGASAHDLVVQQGEKDQALLQQLDHPPRREIRHH